MKVKRHIVLYLVCAPWNLLVGWPVVLLIRLLWGKELRWETPPYYKTEGGGPALTCQIRPGSFPVSQGRWPKGWYLHDRKTGAAWGATTLGHAIFYGPGGRDCNWPDIWTRTQAHEHVHVEQFEASMLGGFIVGVSIAVVLAVLGHHVAGLILGGLIWSMGYLVMGVGGWLTALLRGEKAYRGSQHEESAYAQTERLQRLSKGKGL